MAQLDLSYHPKPVTPPPRMSPARFRSAFFRDIRIRIYLIIGTILTLSTLLTFGPDWRLAAGAAAVIIVFPFAEYGIHRFLFHNRQFYRWRPTARFWRFLHLTHHMNPNDPNQVIGPPQFIIPTMIVVSLLLGWLVAGAPGAGAAVATGIWLVVVYEYAHASAHLVAEPVSGYGRLVRHLHMLHHYHNEKGNFGITSPIADLIFGTYYSDATKVERCPTVRNLGYTPEEAKRYPWAAED